jgi:peptidoglycan/LPS O-acetylase OafA/YrhL
MVVLAFLGLLLMGLFTVFFAPVTILLHYCAPPSWDIPLIYLLIDAAASFLAGRKVAGLAAGRELPAAFAVVALSAVFNVLEVCPALLAHGIRHPYSEIEHRSAILCVQALFVMAGATLKRRRALARRQIQTSSPRLGS